MKGKLQKKFGIDIVACYGENPKWRKEFNSLIMQFKIGSSPIACAIVVQNTACSETVSIRLCL